MRFTTGHIGLNVSDLARSRQFYQEVFGFQVVTESSNEGKRFAFLAQDGTLLLTLWQQSTGDFAPNRLAGTIWRSVDSIDQVREVERRLRDRAAVIHHGGIVSHREGASSAGVFFEDPDGIRLEVYAPAGAVVGSAPYGAAPTCGFF